MGGGLWSEGGCLVWEGGGWCLICGGVWSEGGTTPPPPPEMATAAIGTHPTGMYSCMIGVSSSGKTGEPVPGVSTEEDADIVGPVPEDDEDDDDHTNAKLEYVVLSDFVETLTFLVQTSTGILW